MANKDNGKGQWKDVGSGFDDWGEGLGCLVDLVGCGLGCMVPTLLFLVVAIFGVGATKKPVQRFGTQIVARVQRMRLKFLRNALTPAPLSLPKRKERGKTKLVMV